MRYRYYIVYYFQSSTGSGHGCTEIERNTKISCFDDIVETMEFLRAINHCEALIIENWRRIKPKKKPISFSVFSSNTNKNNQYPRHTLFDGEADG